MTNPPTGQQLDEIEERAACRLVALTQWLDRHSPCSGQDALENAEGVLQEDVPMLVAEVRRLRAAMEEIRHLHKDSPMGPCPVCIDADAVAAGNDGLMPYPCPTGRLAGAQDFDPPHVRVVAYRSPGTRKPYCVICARQVDGRQPLTAADVQPDTVCDFCGGSVHEVASQTLAGVVAQYMDADNPAASRPSV